MKKVNRISYHEVVRGAVVDCGAHIHEQGSSIDEAPVKRNRWR